ncbi:protein shisa-1-like [Otolemur garnettii]|uniref:protein shisa-1-like n=1 Tax=Otolemur garnettii TaxID=30611 RepID=UPI000C7F24B7|nr:protein shisa-1-like [Otolemur garnettii]
MSSLPVMGKTQRSGLGLLLQASALLLAMPSGVKPQGEFCHSWIDSAQLWHEGFQCPGGYDKSTDVYCCGTCSFRYCCATLKTRMDQGLCPEDVPWHSKEAMLPAPEGSIYLPLVIVGSTFVTFILLGILAGIACYWCRRPQRRDELYTAPQNPEPTVPTSNPISGRNASQGSPLHIKPDADPVPPFSTQEYSQCTIVTIPPSVTRRLPWPLFGLPCITSLIPSTTVFLPPAPQLAGKASYRPASGLNPPGTLI